MFYIFLVSCWYITVFKIVFLFVLCGVCVSVCMCVCLHVQLCVFTESVCVCLCVHISCVYVFVCMCVFKCVCCTFYAFCFLIFSLFLHSTFTFLCSFSFPVYFLKKKSRSLELGGWGGQENRRGNEGKLSSNYMI